jgi:hypothetical protein
MWSDLREATEARASRLFGLETPVIDRAVLGGKNGRYL